MEGLREAHDAILEAAEDNPGQALLDERDRLRAFVEKIASDKPKERVDWHDAHGSYNYDDCESNGYDICAWRHGELAEQALRRNLMSLNDKLDAIGTVLVILSGINGFIWGWVARELWKTRQEEPHE